MSLPAPSVEYETPRIPLVGHLAALGIVLVLVLAIVGTTSIFSADEGAAIIQARSLADGEGWIVDHPLPGIDPDGIAYPIELSKRGAEGVAPFAKHPTYAKALALAARGPDLAGMLALSVAGTLLAAWSAARLSERVRPGSAVLALWVTGIGTPLLLSSGLVMAHALSAGLVGAALLAVVKYWESRRVSYLLAGAALGASTVLVRGEGPLFVAAVVLAVWLVGRSQVGAVRATGSAVVLGVAGVAAYLSNEWVTSSIVGSSGGIEQAVPAAGGSFLSDRVFSFFVTWLLPSYDTTGTGTSLLVVSFVCAALSGVLWRARIKGRRSQAGDGGIVLLLGASAGALVLRVAVGDHSTIPGLLMAVPYMVVALLLLRRESFSTATARLCGVTTVLATLAILLTQYRTGGSGEWGGRYFALLLPLMVPVLLPAVVDGLTVFDDRRRHLVTAALGLGTVAVAVLAVGTLRSVHQANEEYVAEVERVSAHAPEPGDAGAPVVVATSGWMPRTAFSLFDERRWLHVDESDDGLSVDQLEFLADGLARSFAGVTVVAEPDDRLPELLEQRMRLVESGPVVASRDDVVYVFGLAE